MTLYKSILIGLFGSFLMFLGDMTLYYDPNDYDGKDAINSVIGIMKNVSIKRLYIGGLLGPISAFIYCLGFYHIVLAMQEKYLTIGWFIFLTKTFGIILGGSFHIQSANLGLLSRHENKGALDESLKFLKLQGKIVFVIAALANLALALVILSGLTVFPKWQVLFTPMFLLILTPLTERLPKGLHMIICGGWFNLIYFIYYLSLLMNYTSMNF